MQTTLPYHLYGNYYQGYLFFNFILLKLNFFCLLIAHRDVHTAILRACGLLLRSIILKFIEMATAIYDPYRPLMAAQLWPGDWSGWPTGALPPCLAIARGQAQLGKSGYTLHISRERIHRIDDRATTFAYQPYDSEKLQDLRTKYNFDALLGGNASEITTLAILNDWTRCQWKHGPSKNVNFLQFYAGDIIQRGMRGEQFSCQVAAMTFSQIVSAIGYQARLVSLFPYRGGPQHAVSEVWVNDLAKWVAFDTDFNLYYVSKCGVPLNVLELHKGLLNGRSGDIMVVKGLYRPETFDIEEVSEKPLLLPYYRYFFVDMRNDWMTNVYFRGHPKRSDQATLRWREEGQKKFIDLKPTTNDESELYWPLNQVEIRICEIEINSGFIKLNLVLKTVTPNFERFEIEVNKTEKRSQGSSHLEWWLTPGVNMLSVRAVNKFGVKGSFSYLEIFLQ